MTSHAKGRRLLDGNFSDLCAADCGAESGVCACARLKPTVQYLARLACLSCSREVAAVELADERQPVRISPALRCQHCGGQPTLDSIEQHRLEPRLPRQLPRRGRPPRWLKELRRSA
jgi:DNA-directed RNA polymerase subunit RPC12/RpoP